MPDPAPPTDFLDDPPVGAPPWAWPGHDPGPGHRPGDRPQGNGQQVDPGWDASAPAGPGDLGPWAPASLEEPAWAPPQPQPQPQPQPPTRPGAADEDDHDQGGAGPERPRWPWVVVGVVLLILCTMVGSLAVLLDRLQSDAQKDRTAAAATQKAQAEQDQAAINALSERLGRLETQVGQQPDLAKVARDVGPSVYTVQTTKEIGSGFAIVKLGTATGVVTDYHVIKDAWESGNHQVLVVRSDPPSTLTGTIQKVDPADDLALVSVDADLPLLQAAKAAPLVGDPILAVGSPLGLGGSATSGIVSAFRNGKLQFSAPVSPGNSGGPVVDRQGHVVGVTQSKLVGDATEGLGFATLISVVCQTMATC